MCKLLPHSNRGLRVPEGSVRVTDDGYDLLEDELPTISDRYTANDGIDTNLILTAMREEQAENVQNKAFKVTKEDVKEVQKRLNSDSISEENL